MLLYFEANRDGFCSTDFPHQFRHILQSSRNVHVYAYLSSLLIKTGAHKQFCFMTPQYIFSASFENFDSTNLKESAFSCVQLLISTCLTPYPYMPIDIISKSSWFNLQNVSAISHFLFIFHIQSLSGPSFSTSMPTATLLSSASN